METFTLFGWNIAEFFSADRIAAFVRFSILLFVGLPLVYALSKWANRYATKRISAQQGMIFDNAVVDNRNPPTRCMGMRVRLGRLSMCRPARVCNARAAIEGLLLLSRFQLFHLAVALVQAQALLIIDQRHTG